eukprot:1188205-Prorocentrum_minimum.AAC.1
MEESLAAGSKGLAKKLHWLAQRFGPPTRDPVAARAALAEEATLDVNQGTPGRGNTPVKGCTPGQGTPSSLALALLAAERAARACFRHALGCGLAVDVDASGLSDGRDEAAQEAEQIAAFHARSVRDALIEMRRKQLDQSERSVGGGVSCGGHRGDPSGQQGAAAGVNASTEAEVGKKKDEAEEKAKAKVTEEAMKAEATKAESCTPPPTETGPSAEEWDLYRSVVRRVSVENR